MFVCVGTYRGSNKMAVWVMTLTKNFEMVKFWDCVTHQQHLLKGRIVREEVQNLKTYLRPGMLTKKEEEEKARIANWKK